MGRKEERSLEDSPAAIDREEDKQEGERSTAATAAISSRIDKENGESHRRWEKRRQSAAWRHLDRGSSLLRHGKAGSAGERGDKGR